MNSLLRFLFGHGWYVVGYIVFYLLVIFPLFWTFSEIKSIFIYPEGGRQFNGSGYGTWAIALALFMTLTALFFLISFCVLLIKTHGFSFGSFGYFLLVVVTVSLIVWFLVLMGDVYFSGFTSFLLMTAINIGLIASIYCVMWRLQDNQPIAMQILFLQLIGTFLISAIATAIIFVGLHSVWLPEAPHDTSSPSQPNTSASIFTYALYSDLTPLQLKIGDEKTYSSSDTIPPITIKFVNVDQDGRSYTGTVTRAAVVSAQLSVGEQSSNVQFSLWDMLFPSRPSATGKQGGVGNTIAAGPYQVYLVSLLPYRGATEAIDPSRYVATFMVDTIQGYATKQKAIDLAQAELAKRAPNDALRYYPAQLKLENKNDPDVYRVEFGSFAPDNYYLYWMDVNVVNNAVTRFEYVESPRR